MGNRKMNNRKPNAGVTVMELLIGLAFVLILCAFVAPNLQRDSGRAEMQRALGEFNTHLEMARFAARRLNSEITVAFHKEARARHHSISFMLPAQPGHEPVLREYQLPENVRLHSPQSEIRFDAQGITEEGAQVELTSERNSLVFERFLVE
jgi:Tfp pilus assembly protein FimT